jgi:Tol biopolymer transport system component
MLAGRPAFSRDNNAETISSILNDAPDLTLVPAQVRQILKKCLAKHVDRRYVSATELLDDLEAVRKTGGFDEGLSASATSPGGKVTTNDSNAAKKRHFYFWQGSSEIDAATHPAFNNTTGGGHGSKRRINCLPIATASAVVLAGIAAVWIWQSNQTATENNFDSLRAVRLVSWKSGAVTNATDFTMSHDGRMIAFSSSQQGGRKMIYIKQTSDGEDLQVTRDTWTNVSPLWSPDDQRIAFVSLRTDQPGIYVTPTLGGPITLLKLTNGMNLSLRHWTRDGLSILYDQAGNLWRLDLHSGETMKLTDLPEVWSL